MLVRQYLAAPVIRVTTGPIALTKALQWIRLSRERSVGVVLTSSSAASYTLSMETRRSLAFALVANTPAVLEAMLAGLHPEALARSGTHHEAGAVTADNFVH